MDPNERTLGNCACAFWLAVSFDLLGIVLLLTGVFANVYYYDFLIYAGAIIIFLSLAWWMFWYTGNIEVPPAELQDDIGLPPKHSPGEGLPGAVRGLSRRLSRGIMQSLRNRSKTLGETRAFSWDGQPQPGGRPSAPRIPTGVHTVSEAVEFDTLTTHAVPDV